MTDVQQRAAAKEFTAYWAGRGDEKQETQRFWIDLLRNVYGVAEPEKAIEFECPVKLDHVSFIDGYIKDTRVLIEQKGADIDLRRGYKQSDGSMLTPYQQARRYAGYLPHDKNPRWIVVCNFREFHVHDMNRPNDEPEVVTLADLEKEYHRLNFLVDTGDENIKKEMEISLQAGEIVGALYDTLLKQYKDPESPETLKSLNALCVRLVFCLYAEDAEIFGGHGKFHDYMQRHQSDARRALMDLFQVLDTRPEDRDPYMDDDLASFPYVNGGLFADEHIIIPRLDETIVELILQRASADFDWSSISPTIFGAVFESTLNPETRRSGGMHYTSIENIHKVIDPLFLDDLRGELADIQAVAVETTRKRRLRDFQHKLAGLKFLDPACGSGNFLTETYISLRKLENEVLRSLSNQIVLGDFINPIQVSIGQFYGIEINDFAVSVAKTALWIAESQMMKETEDIIHMSLDFLPLKSYANIVEGNALRMDWESVVPKHELDYIMGNPPFVGYSLQSKEQKEDILSIYIDEKGKPYKTAGKIDYVSGWYFKASAFMQKTCIHTAFVSTNSITQGEQVAGVWKPLYDQFGIHIDFAHRTFRWDSEASLKAHVHCVIVGFSVASNDTERRLYTTDRMAIVENINPYLIDAPNIFIESRTKPICHVLEMTSGNRPADGGHLIIEANDYEEFVSKEPKAIPYLKRLSGATEFINNKKRWCLWLVGVSPAELRKMPKVMERIELCKLDRLNGADDRKKLADTPALFRETKNPETAIVVPRHSTENRRYIPFGFIGKEMILTDAAMCIPNATIYDFGILESNVHMAWTRAVCGRIKSDYRYSKDIVYNNFPWPTPTDEQKAKIEETAQAILDARALYPDSSLADLYDETTMPPELRKAHQQNDKAVMRAYGFDIKTTTETSCVAELMKMYQKLMNGGGR
ncbi:class I SAM-dependent DNA methyltransferase [Flavonifractor sp. An112]|uniref:class I SAM-dependent DNA methyltransferase n=1 Tax=Flavonifractor sp. An112 TaxID=1965544 RepID=UPI001748A0A1|nr:class I SAM-dependent DNA methyltransferase [Flavonifractor sp. An112]HIZ94148.1 methylase [Candidatus Flavonifractor avicola]